MSSIKTARFLTSVLRHRAHEHGLSMMADGSVAVSDLLKLSRLAGVTIADIKTIVVTCDKQRFALLTDDAGNLRIRANQGHSATLALDDDAMLTPITDAASVPVAVHGTFSAALPAIRESGCLKRMTRRHVHFAPGLPNDGVISGMRAKCDVLCFLDVPAALAAGLKLFRSANGVILCTDDVPLRFLRIELIN
jgi:2'-phosphotransferase